MTLLTLGLLSHWPVSSHAQDTTSTVTLRIDVQGNTQEVVIELDEANAPRTCANFKQLANQGYFDGIAFHRVIPNYIVQAGDPLTKDASQKHLWGTGGPGYTIPAEIGLPHERGSVAMARLGDAVNPKKASSGSQFYVALARLPKLDREYTVFGKVVSGLEVLEQIASAPSDSNNNPSERVEIVAASVKGGVAPTVAAAKVPAPAAPEASSVADTPPPATAKSTKKEAAAEGDKEKAAEVAMTDSKAKKESWLKRTFGKKGSKEKSEPKEEVASEAPAAKPAPIPAPAAAAPIASNNSEPTYRNDGSSDIGSSAPAQEAAESSLASEMNTARPDEDDPVIRDDADRGFFGRFLYRYW